MSNGPALFRIDPTTLQDPYPMLAQLRAVEPVHRIASGEVVVTRYDDAVNVLKDRRFGRAGMEDRFKQAQGLVGKPTYILPAMFADPPAHSRLRGVLSRAFTASIVNALVPTMEQVTSELLDRIATKDSFDLVATVAYPLPITTICHLLGMPLEDHERIHALAEAHAAALSCGRLRDETREIIERADRLRNEWAEYFGKLAEERRAAPRSDFVSSLVRAHDEDENLTEYELKATLVGLLFAGHMTTADSIGSGMLALLSNREQWEMLVRDPALVDGAVEEVLRYEPAVQVYGRLALEDADVAGVPVPKGTNVLVMSGGANRDPAYFTDPERFDITREPNRHMAFGSGIHFCSGSAVAKAQLRVVLSALSKRFPNLRLHGEPPKFRPSFGFRGLARLELSRS